MAGRKKLFHNYLLEKCVQATRDDGIPIHSFVGLKEEEIPKMDDIGKLVYHASDVANNEFTPYKTQGFENIDGNLIFLVHDYYRIVDGDEIRESLGASRTFYQTDIVLIPENYAIKRHRSVP